MKIIFIILIFFIMYIFINFFHKSNLESFVDSNKNKKDKKQISKKDKKQISKKDKKQINQRLLEYQKETKKLNNLNKKVDYNKFVDNSIKNNSCINKDIIIKPKPFYHIEELDSTYNFYFKQNSDLIKNKIIINRIYPYNFDKNLFLKNNYNETKYSKNDNIGLHFKNNSVTALNSSDLKDLKDFYKNPPKILDMYEKPLDWKCIRKYYYTNGLYNLSKKYS